MTETKSLYRKLATNLTAEVPIAPLAVFRVLYGALMLFATLRFIARGWVAELYIQPKFFFHYFGFSWVKPPIALGLPNWVTYAVFALMALAALGILVGYYYRIAALSFAVLFSYVELWDVTNYLNHYYFVSLVSLLMVVLPANRAFALDTWRNPSLKASHVPFWTIFIIQLQVGIVYFMAGVAKLNPDWLLEAQPLRLWLSAHSTFPIIGNWLTYTWVAYFFSWFGLTYDLTIPFWLSLKKTRKLAYGAVVAFHVLTWLLFPIGVFPWVMIGLTLIYFPAPLHQYTLRYFKYHESINFTAAPLSSGFSKKVVVPIICMFFVFQLAFPFRHMAYPGNLFWTEQGYRFSWRVMLMEKTGHIQFYVTNPETGQRQEVRNSDYLSNLQEKMMATQPDLILQFAHFLANKHTTAQHPSPAVYADSYVALNGRRSKRYFAADLDLTQLEDNWSPKNWLFPFTETQSSYAAQ